MSPRTNSCWSIGSSSSRPSARGRPRRGRCRRRIGGVLDSSASSASSASSDTSSDDEPEERGRRRSPDAELREDLAAVGLRGTADELRANVGYIRRAVEKKRIFGRRGPLLRMCGQLVRGGFRATSFVYASTVEVVHLVVQVVQTFPVRGPGRAIPCPRRRVEHLRLLRGQHGGENAVRRIA